MTSLVACSAVVLSLAAADLKQTKVEQLDATLLPVLWRDPGQLTSRDWVCGPGGCDGAPTPPFRFIREELSGTNPKVSVRDAHDLTWSVKFGPEVIPECFASRFVTAAGYFAEPTYFVSSGKVVGVGSLQRARRIVKKDGSFTKGRFELRGQKDLVYLEGHSWSWVENPFRGSHELAGLKIVMMLLSNWDSKDARDGEESNNGIFRRLHDGKEELAYGVFDWGATLGRWGGELRRDQSDCVGYARDTPKFINAVRQDQPVWGFSGKHAQDLKAGISVDDVRWLLPYLVRITAEQLRAGLQASGATERQTGCWAEAIEHRIQRLQAIAR